MNGGWPEITALLTGVGLLITAGVFAVRAIIRDELRPLDDKYVGVKLADERHREHERRITVLEDRAA